MKSENGFTLIELVMVIVILGVLAAVAIPNFVDLRSDANTAALNGVAGALSSAAAVNYAARTANSTKGVAVANCTAVQLALLGGLPGGYGIVSQAVAAGAAQPCVVSNTTSATVGFTAIGIT